MTKEPLVLLPGTLCDETMWHDQVETLKDVSDITLGDLTKSDTITGLAQDVLAKAPKNFSLAGFSLGGIVALEIMRVAPERVKKLALMSSNPFPPKEEQHETWNTFIHMSENDEFIEVTKNHLLPVLINDVHRTNELEKTIIVMAENIGATAYVNQLKAVMTRADQRVILPTITCPTTVIVGEADVVCPVTLTEYIVAQVPQAKKVVIEDAGHLLTLEKPAEVSNSMKEWLLT